MILKSQKVDMSRERQILIGLIVSDEFIRGIRQIFDERLLQSMWSRKITKWCIDYFDKYQKVIGMDIQAVFESENRAGRLDEADAEAISTFLQDLSDAYSENPTFNAPYVIDQAELYFRLRVAEQLHEDLKLPLMNEDIDRVEHLIGSFKKKKRSTTRGIDLLKDKDAIIEAFNFEEIDVLFSLPGVLGHALGPLCRGDFLGVLGPPGRGKSWWLMYIAITALLKKLRVVFFTLEMTQNQIIRRAYHCFCRETKNAEEIMVPVLDCELNQKNKCSNPKRTSSRGLDDPFFDVYEKQYHKFPVDYHPCKVCRGTNKFRKAVWFKKVKKQGMDSSKALRMAKALKHMVSSGQFHLVAFPKKTKTILDIMTYLDNLEYYEGFIPDVVVTDLADNCRAVNLRQEFRHQINETIEYHCALAEQRHCLVVTGSHTNKATFDRRIRQGDTSEDNRKMAHFTKAMALNQTPTEKQQGIMRIGITKLREDNFNPNTDVFILEQLSMGRPYLISI